MRLSKKEQKSRLLVKSLLRRQQPFRCLGSGKRCSAAAAGRDSGGRRRKRNLFVCVEKDIVIIANVLHVSSYLTDLMEASAFAQRVFFP